MAKDLTKDQFAKSGFDWSYMEYLENKGVKPLIAPWLLASGT